THLAVLMALIKGEQPPEMYPLFKKLLAEYRVLVGAAGIVIVSSAATPAMASDLSNNAYNRVSAQRQQLLIRYDATWKAADHINSDIALLEKTADRDDRALDTLYRDLKDKKDDLHKIELDIRDLDKVLL
ncbi:MAG: hypothetical protein ACRD3W_07195, partial [Terriglobales bacterium]